VEAVLADRVVLAAIPCVSDAEEAGVGGAPGGATLWRCAPQEAALEFRIRDRGRPATTIDEEDELQGVEVTMELDECGAGGGGAGGYEHLDEAL